MEERCFICGHKMDTSTGLCTNKDCPRSKSIKKETAESKD